YGMSARVGTVKLGSADDEPFLGREMASGRDFSDELAFVVDEEVRKLMDTAHGEAYWILTENRDILDNLAARLLEEETLNRHELAEIFTNVRKYAPRDTWLFHQDRPVSEIRRVDMPAGTATDKPRYSDTPTDTTGDVDDGSRGAEQERQLSDHPRIGAEVREMRLAGGEDPGRERLIDTPARVARAYEEFFAGLAHDPDELLSTTFDISHEEMVLVKDIEFYSMCEHHLVPFHGKAHIGYIPSAEGKVTGLSKLARLVELYARRPQVQERLTTQIVEAIMGHLDPAGAIVVISAEHMCM